MCLDMPKFGGPGKRKKKCQQRVCVTSTKKNSVLSTKEILTDFKTAYRCIIGDRKKL